MQRTNAKLDTILWRHISSLPYFRGFLRAVEDCFYQEIHLPGPVFDLGSGDGHFTSVAFDRKLDVGLDPWVPSMREASKRNAHRFLVLGEGGQIPFKDGSFGSVASTSVLEHIPAIMPVLAEVWRILAPGGKFVFCVPNHRFTNMLWGRRLFEYIGFPRLGAGYARLFNRISRHIHTDSPDIWKKRLDSIGFELIDCWDYFPVKALHILEWGHFFGLPSWVMKKLFGRWILVQQKWNLIIPWILTRPYMGEARSEEGAYSFFVASKMG